MLPVHGSRTLRMERMIRCCLLAAMVLSLFASLPAGSASARPLMALSYQAPVELTVQGNGFGAPMALSGNTLVIGAPSAGAKGAVYVFDRDPNTGVWGAATPITPPNNLSTNAQFGMAVAIENDTLVIGANMDSLSNQSDSGAVYIYKRTASGWTMVQGGTEFYSPAKGDRFGESLAISGNTIAVGAPFYDSQKSIKNSGTVYLFKWDTTAGKWIFVKALQDPNEIIKKNRNDMFGASLAVEGDTLVVGASRANGVCNIECGSVSVYSRNSGGIDNWGRVAIFQSNPLPQLPGTYFGQAVAISGGRIVVGAPYTTYTGVDSYGRAYAFELTSNNSWTQVTTLVSPVFSTGDLFGGAIGIDGDLLVVGAKNSDSTGLTNPGAVFAFTRNQATSGFWSLKDIQPTLTNPASGDLLGSAVMVNGQSIIAGAPGRKISNNTGQGAVYFFSPIDTTTGGETNHPPELDLDSLTNGTGFLTTFKEPAYPTESLVPVSIINAAGLAVVDVDNPSNPTLFSAMITLTNPMDGEMESLQADVSGSVSVIPYKVTAINGVNVGVLKLTSTDISGKSPLSEFQKVLNSVKYKNTSSKPNTSYRYIDIVVNDGTSDSNTAVSTIVIIPAKERPVITFAIAGEAPYQINQSYAVNVSVARPGAVGAEAGVPSGQVILTLGSGAAAQTCTATLTKLNEQDDFSGGSCTITITSVGSIQSTAAYQGDTEFSAWDVSTSFLFDYHKLYLPNLGKLLP